MSQTSIEDTSCFIGTEPLALEIFGGYTIEDDQVTEVNEGGTLLTQQRYHGIFEATSRQFGLAMLKMKLIIK